MLVPLRMSGPPAALHGELGVDLAALLTRLQVIIAKSDQYSDVIMNVLDDPALPEVINLVRQLHAEAAKPLAGPAPAGIGLSKVVGPLKLYVRFRKNPVPYYLGAAGIVLAIVGGSVAVGRWSKKAPKCRA